MAQLFLELRRLLEDLAQTRIRLVLVAIESIKSDALVDDAASNVLAHRWISVIDELGLQQLVGFQFRLAVI